MDFFGTLFIAFGLSMDAFAVAVCKGLSRGRITNTDCAVCGLWFGTFQGIMPLFGFIIGSASGKILSGIDHYVSFFLLVFIGVGMISEAKEENSSSSSFGFFAMLSASVATSIDAFSAGITFGLLPGCNVFRAAFSIFAVTFLMSYAGVRLGSHFGMKGKRRASLLGGCILIFMGIKILWEHTGFSFFGIL